MPFPDLDKFMTDPKHEKEREFMKGFIRAVIEEEVKKKKQQPAEKNLFDELFGGNDE